MKENCPIRFESSYYENINNYHTTKEGSVIQIVDYKTNKEVYYRFVKDIPIGYEKYIFCTTLQNIMKGQIRNPFIKNLYGGYLGIDTTYRSKEYKWVYNIWLSMLRRVEKSSHEVIDTSWFDYSVFASWYISEYNKRNHNMDYMISNGILYNLYKNKTNGLKVYGPSYCELVPRYFDINEIDSYYRNNYISERLYRILKGDINVL